MHLVVIWLVDSIDNSLFRTFADAACAQRTRPAILLTAPVFFSAMTIVVFDLFEFDFLLLWTYIVISVFMIGESIAFRFILTKVGNVSFDVTRLECFKCLATAT